MNHATKRSKEELRAQLMGQIAGFGEQKRQALRAAALVHGFALVAFVTLFWFAVDLRSRVSTLEKGSAVAPVASGTAK